MTSENGPPYNQHQTMISANVVLKNVVKSTHYKMLWKNKVYLKKIFNFEVSIVLVDDLAT